MFPQRWIVWHLLLAVPLALCSLDSIQNNSGVNCSQGLLHCTMKAGTPFDFNSVQVTDLSPQVKLCCRGHTCALCLLIHVEVDLDKPGEEEGNSGLTDDEETKDNEGETGSVTVCYQTPEGIRICKKIEFTVNRDRIPEQSAAQITMTITNAVISYKSLVTIDSPNVEKTKAVNAPSLTDVCSSDMNTYVQECKGHVPKVNFSINKVNQVELHFPGSDSGIPVVCLQNEEGSCQRWDGKPIPLESVTPCTCFQVWKGDDQMRPHLRCCPFKNNTTLGVNVWKNLTVSVDKRYIDDSGPMLRWNVSAPCRLQGEVWACDRTPGPAVCTERQGFRSQLREGHWRQNSNGRWETVGVFSQINLDNHPCVMININEMGYEMGPFCYNNINRWRWSLFAVAVMMLLSLTLLITFGLRKFIKKSVQSWRHGGFGRTVHKAHVLLLSPPDSDVEVSAAVCNLGSLLSFSDFSVTVDQWSHQGQFRLGPLPWSHCQLLSMDSQSERVVLVLTPKAVERAQTWSSQDSPVTDLQEDSPYSDVFRASLFAIQAFKNQARASERFVLVTFDYLWTGAKICHNKLPEILRGLPLFHFPSQTKALLADLCVGRTPRQSDRRQIFFSENKYKTRETLQEPETQLLP